MTATSLSDPRPGAAGGRSAPVTPRGEEVDWKGLWFKLEEEVSGEFIGMRAGRRVAGKPDVDWLFLSHHRHDGFSGLAHTVRELGCTAEIKFPALAEAKTPSLWARTVALLRYVAKPQRPAAAWKTLDVAWRPPPGGAEPTKAISTHAFSAGETQRLSQLARADRVSLNSLLLSALAKASKPDLLPGPEVWCLPVNMRGGVSLKREAANHSTYVDIDLGGAPTPRKAHEAVKAALGRLEHWASWTFLSNIGRFVGYDGMRRIFAHSLKATEGRQWIGTFSNMGKWDGIGEWFVAPGVTYSSPLGVGIIICDGRLLLSLEAHTSIARDKAFTDTLMQRWLTELGARPETP